ncbi:MAG TPA: DUF4251 domain-containing protein [Candidatus Coprenecus pullistercoris]|nr:DUF4251 domain-containing protein [Candidatus Coprenecus pullistercoris]
MKTKIIRVLIVAVTAALSVLPAEGKDARDSLFDKTVETMRNMDFVLEADRIVMPDGTNVMVQSVTNFVAVQGDNAVIQISTLRGSGSNGVGGLTVQGDVGDVDLSTDRRGNVVMRMTVIGGSVSVSMMVTLYKGGNGASVRIDPNYGFDDISMMGTVVPAAMSTVHVGRIK